MKSTRSLLNEARRLQRECRAGNPFVTADVLERHLGKMQAVYLRSGTPAVTAQKLHTEIDVMGETIDEAVEAA